jgi:hypothetical protein
MIDGLIYLLTVSTFVAGIFVGIGIGVRFGAAVTERLMETKAFGYICDKIDEWR